MAMDSCHHLLGSAEVIQPNEEQMQENLASSAVPDSRRVSTRAGRTSYTAMDVNRCVILEGTDDEMICSAYRETTARTILFYFLVLITVGLILLIFYWKPDWKVRVRSVPCSVESAKHVILHDRYDRHHVKRIQELTHPNNLKIFKRKSDKQHPTGDSSKPYLSLSRITKSGLQASLFFEHKFQKFLWNGESFLPLRGFDFEVTVHDLQDMAGGLCEAEKRLRRILFGLNSIAVEITPMITVLFREILHPFYIFQLFAIAVWCADEYYSLPAVIVITSTITISLSLYLTRKQNRMIANMSSGSGPVRVLVNGNFEKRQSTKLLPGDVIEIEANQTTVWCDCVVLSGCCVVSESMLTGESVPVVKGPLESSNPVNDYYDQNRHRQHTLYGGTKVLDVYSNQGTDPPRAVVIRTGFYTEKGKMIESMLSPSPLDYTHYNDSLKFILVMAIFGLFGCALTITFLSRLGADAGLIVKRVLDLLTIVVPPGLPAAMTIATIYAQRRLRKAQIFCISPPRIAISGKIDCMCFDKTGTLTENDLKLWGVVPCSDKSSDDQSSGVQKPAFAEAIHDSALLPGKGEIGQECFYALASCHSLVSIDGEISGDPIDLELFKSTNWKMTKPNEDWCSECNFAFSAAEDDEIKLALARVYQFNSAIRRMSVIAKGIGDDRYHVYVKGAPETIAKQCNQCTVPANFEEKLLSYTRQGYRVLALATKDIEIVSDVGSVERDFAESNLRFLGLVVLKNPLKPGTTDTIAQLNSARIRTVMATGDNLETAIHVAKECKMVGPADNIVIVKAEPTSEIKRVALSWEPLEAGDDESSLPIETSFSSLKPIVENPPNARNHLAMTGDTLELIRTHSNELYNRVLMSATVLARMKPEHKRYLVEGLQETKYTVGMCGDGANDSGALKAAHSGIAIAEIEASIVAPFTSMKSDISCCIKLIREGRAALVTSFGMMKFLCIYCFVQYLSLIFLYTISSYLSDIQFLFADLGVTTLVTLFFAIGRASPVLHKSLPHTSIVSPVMLSCLLLQIVALVLVQTASFLTLQNQSWHTPLVPNLTDPKANIVCNENTVLFYTSCFQDMMLAFVFYEALPHKEPVYKNVPYFVGFILLSTWTLIMFFVPVEPILSFFSLTTLNYDVAFRFVLLSFYIVNIIFATFIEKFLLHSKSYARFLSNVGRKLSRVRQNTVEEDKDQQPVYHYQLRKQLEQDPAWPPVGQKTSINV